jgi:tetratricopeptide (TPR) repeat protein
VENIDVFGDPQRILPALLASESAMPGSWNASLRVAQIEREVKNYDASLAACDRGLARTPGPLGRAWLLQVKADALQKKGRTVEARRALEEALEAAQNIPLRRNRENNTKRIKEALASMPR